MKKINILAILSLWLLAGCSIPDSTHPQDTADARKADSLWRVRIADSINQARGLGPDAPDANVGADTGSLGIESITRGMSEGLNKVQEGLDKMKKVTEVGTGSVREISSGIKKTTDAINRTLDSARKTISGK